MMWYIKYFWVKLNIFILTPLVWIEKKMDEYNEFMFKYQMNMLDKCDFNKKAA